MAPSAKDVAARTRAALAYANIDVKASTQRIGISPATMARIVSPTKPRGADPDERKLIADACGVPVWFLEYGFNPPADLADETAYGRLVDLEAQLRALADLVVERDREWFRRLQDLGAIRDDDGLATLSDETTDALLGGAAASVGPGSGDSDARADGPGGAPPARTAGTRHSGQRHAL